MTSRCARSTSICVSYRRDDARIREWHEERCLSCGWHRDVESPRARNHPFLTVDGWVHLATCRSVRRVARHSRRADGRRPPRHHSAGDLGLHRTQGTARRTGRARARHRANVSVGMRASPRVRARDFTFDHGRIATALPDRFLADLGASDVLWDEVVAIDPQGEAAGVRRNGAAARTTSSPNDIVVHNSIEQDADVVHLHLPRRATTTRSPNSVGWQRSSSPSTATDRSAQRSSSSSTTTRRSRTRRGECRSLSRTPRCGGRRRSRGARGAGVALPRARRLRDRGRGARAGRGRRGARPASPAGR